MYNNTTPTVRRVRKSALLAMLVSCALNVAVAAADLQTRHQFQIPAQPLDTALLAFSDQAKVQVLMWAGERAGTQSPGAVGELSALDALESILGNTGLAYKAIDQVTVAIVAPAARGVAPAQAASAAAARNDRPAGFWSRFRLARAESSAAQRGTPQSAAERAKEIEELEEIIVTGTHIRGISPESSPLTIYTSEEIRNTGATTVEQFIAKLPQNLNSLSTSGVGAKTHEFNQEQANGIDLRGLGVGTTLVLLNGRRLALAAEARTPDLSMLPLGAIERVEVLTDGSSAIYGSDAVSGVVNFVLRDDFEGAETVLGYGSVTSGDHDEKRFEQTVGHGWESGNALAHYSFFDVSDLDASDRTFSRAAGPPFTLLPADRRHNVLVSAKQSAPLGIELFTDLLYSRRDAKSVMRVHGVDDFGEEILELRTIANDHEQWFANLGGRKELSESIGLEVIASYSQLRSDAVTIVRQGTTEEADIPQGSESSTLDVTAKIDGDLFAIPGGNVKFSLGAGHSSDKYDTRAVSSVRDFHVSTNRTTKYAFGELFVPLVAPEQNVSAVERLELSMAARYTEYSDFGGKASPKVGLLWSPLASLNLRGSYSESYRAPFLSQIDETQAGWVLIRPVEFGFEDFWGTPEDPSVVAFSAGGGNAALTAEESKSYTFGLDYEPEFLPGVRVTATYFDIQYEKRIALGDPSGFAAFVFPEQFPELIIVRPTAADLAPIVRGQNTINTIDVDPTDLQAVAAVTDVLVDNRLRNLSSSDLNGIDLGIDYVRGGGEGSLRIGAQATYLIDSTQRTSSLSPTLTRVDTLFNPADLRIRGYVGYSRGRYNAQLNANYVDGYVNPLADGGPQPIDSWTTFDLTASYEFERLQRSLLSGLRVALSVQNLLDEDPPFVGRNVIREGSGLNEPIGYDAANANPLGRFVTLQVAKSW